MGGWTVGHTGADPAYPCRRSWRQRRQERSAGASCCRCATALSGAACWWVCYAAPTSPPWMPMATQTPSSACECEQGDRWAAGVPQSPYGTHLSRAAPTLSPSFPISFLHPNVGKKSKYKTSVRKKTLNPEFNEVGRGHRGGSAGCWAASRLRERGPSPSSPEPSPCPGQPPSCPSRRSSSTPAQGRSWPRRRCWCPCGIMTWARPTTSLVSGKVGSWGGGSSGLPHGS